MRTWMRLLPAVLLAVPFFWSSLRAEEKTNDQKIADLQKEVSELRKEVGRLKDEVKDSGARGAKVAEDVQDIKKMLRDLAEKQAVISRQSAYGPLSVPPGSPLSPTATIMLQNNYSATATVHINGRPFVVEPGQSVRIPDVPTGRFQYSVDVEGFGPVGPGRTDNLPAAGYRIRIFPQVTF